MSEMSNYEIVLAVLGRVCIEKGWIDGQSAREARAALEEMRRDGERLDWLLEHQPWLSEVTREKLDVWMKLGGGDAQVIREPLSAARGDRPCVVCPA